MRKAVTLTFVLFLVLLCGVDRDFSSPAPAPGVPVAPAASAVPILPPMPAIDFVCSCKTCAGGSSLGCRDTSTGRLTSCSWWWASHSGQCH